MQKDATLLGTRCVRLPPPPLLPPFCMLLLFVAQSLKPVKLLATLKRTQQFPALLAQQYTHQVRFRAQVKTGLFFFRLAKQQLCKRITFFVDFFALVAPRRKTA